MTKHKNLVTLLTLAMIPVSLFWVSGLAVWRWELRRSSAFSLTLLIKPEKETLDYNEFL